VERKWKGLEKTKQNQRSTNKSKQGQTYTNKSENPTNKNKQENTSTNKRNIAILLKQSNIDIEVKVKCYIS